MPDNPMNQLIERFSSDSTLSVETIRELVAIQERVLDRESVQAYAADMVECQKAMPTIDALSENKQTSSWYAKLGKIVETIKPIYTDHGFSLSFTERESPQDHHIRVVAICTHRLGHEKEFFRDIPIDDRGIKGGENKTLLHGGASSVTYAERYLTGMIFNLAIRGEDDPDGNQPDVPAPSLAKEETDEMRDRLKAIGVGEQRFISGMAAHFKISEDRFWDAIPADIHAKLNSFITAKEKAVKAEAAGESA